MKLKRYFVKRDGKLFYICDRNNASRPIWDASRDGKDKVLTWTDCDKAIDACKERNDNAEAAEASEEICLEINQIFEAAKLNK